MEEEELLSPDEIRKIENELELKLANMTLEDLEESSGSVLDFLQSFRKFSVEDPNLRINLFKTVVRRGYR